jgi:hypothetical protein
MKKCRRCSKPATLHITEIRKGEVQQLHLCENCAQKYLAQSNPDADDEPLTLAQMRELDRRMKDLDDRTRYLLVSVFGPRFVLYYNVSEDTYGMSEPAHATVFKRRAAAVAVRKMLGDGVQIVQCDVDGHGQLVLNSLPARWRRPPRKAPSRRSPSG